MRVLLRRRDPAASLLNEKKNRFIEEDKNQPDITAQFGVFTQ